MSLFLPWKLVFSQPSVYFNLEKATQLESRLVDAECIQFLEQLEQVIQNGYPSFKNAKITNTTQYNNNFFIFSSDQSTINGHFENINNHFTNSVIETFKKTINYTIDEASHSEQRTKCLQKIIELLTRIKPLSGDEEKVFDLQKNLVKYQREIFQKLIENMKSSKQIEENSIINHEDIFTNEHFRILDSIFEEENSIKSNINACFTIIQKDDQLQNILNNYYNIKLLEPIFLDVEKEKTINTIELLENKINCYLNSQMEIEECFDSKYSYSDLIAVQINLHTVVVDIIKICNEEPIIHIQQKIQQNYKKIMENYKDKLFIPANPNFDDVIQYFEISFKYKDLISSEELSDWYKSMMDHTEIQIMNYLNFDIIFENPPGKNSMLKKYFNFIKNPIHKNFNEMSSTMMNDLLHRIYHIVQEVHTKKIICINKLIKIPNIYDFMNLLLNLLDIPQLQTEVKNVKREIEQFIKNLNKMALAINDINPFCNIKNYESKMMKLLPIWNHLVFLNYQNNSLFYETFQCFKSNLDIKFSDVSEYLKNNPKDAHEYVEIWNKFGDMFHEHTENVVKFCSKKLLSMQQLSGSYKSDIIWLEIIMKIDYKKFLHIKNNIYENMEDKINNSKDIKTFKTINKINQLLYEITSKIDTQNYKKFKNLILQHVKQIYENKLKEWNNDQYWNIEQKDLLENIISTLHLIKNINLNFKSINVCEFDIKNVIILRLNKLANNCCRKISSQNKEFFEIFLFIKSFETKEIILKLFQDDYKIIMRRLIDSCCELYRTLINPDFLPIQSSFELAIELQNLDPIIAQNCKEIFTETISSIEKSINKIVKTIEEKIESYMNYISDSKLSSGTILPNAYVISKNFNKLKSFTWIDEHIHCFVQPRIDQIIDSLSSCITQIDHQIRYVYWRKIEISSEEITFLIQNLQSFAIIFRENEKLYEDYNSTINYCSNSIDQFIDEVNSYINTKDITINFNLQYYWKKLDDIYKIVLELDKKHSYDKVKINLKNCIDTRCRSLVQSCKKSQQNFENIFDELHYLIDWFSGQYKMYYDKALVVVKSDIEDLAFQFNLELENNEFAKAENTLKQIRMKKIALNEFVDENFYGNIGIKIHSPIAITKGKKEIIDTIESLLESQNFVRVKLYIDLLGSDKMVDCFIQSYISRKMREFNNLVIAFDPVSEKCFCKKDLLNLIIPHIRLFTDFWNEIAKIVKWKTILLSIDHLKSTLNLITKEVQNVNDVTRALKIIEREESAIKSIQSSLPKPKKRKNSISNKK